MALSSNLTVSIGADSSKLRADLAIAQQRLKQFSAELRAAAATATQTGDTRPVQRLAASYEAARRQVAGLTGQLRTASSEIGRAGSAFDALAQGPTKRLLTQFDNLSKTTRNIAAVLGGAAGGFAGGFLGGAAVKGVQALVEQLDAVSQKLIEIRDTAREMGQKPLALQGAQEIAAAGGQGAQVGTKMFAGISDQIQKAATATKELTGGVKLFRGERPAEVMEETGEAAKRSAGKLVDLGGAARGAVTAFKGGVPVMEDFSDPLKVIGVDLSKFPDTAEGTLQKTKAITEGFLNWSKTVDATSQRLNELSRQLFQGVPAESALIVAPKLIADIDKKMQELANSARGVDPDKILTQEQLDTAKDRVNVWFRELNASGEQSRLAIGISMNNMVADFLTITLPRWGQGFRDFWPGVLRDLENSWATFNQNLKNNFGKTTEEMFSGMLASFQSAVKSMVDAASRLGEAVSQALKQVNPSGFGDPSIPAMPMASGGMVRGAGSDTSDSILARLSNGEFVMRAAAVRNWGADLLAAMNAGFAMPQLGQRSFAEGGLVAAAAGGGNTVNLHFGGERFVLSADDAVVGALTRASHRGQMRSAGVKPSWFAGRPGGR